MAKRRAQAVKVPGEHKLSVGTRVHVVGENLIGTVINRERVAGFLTKSYAYDVRWDKDPGDGVATVTYGLRREQLREVEASKIIAHRLAS